MKINERIKAIELRKSGMSMGRIAEKLNVSKSSVSYWVRDIKLTSSQLKQLNENGHSVSAIEKRRNARLEKTRLSRIRIMSLASQEVNELKNNPLWCIGTSLYWGEGGKTQGIARIANSDPEVISTMMKYFRKVCQIPEEKLRGHVHTFSHRDVSEDVEYWSKVSGIHTSKFYKTYVKNSIASKRKRDTLPHGTFQIYVHSTEFFYRIMGWIEEIKKQYS